MKNPFQYEGANSLSTNEIIDFYIEDYNYSRFIQSARNIFLVGERGTGKTMTLLYNSFGVQCAKAKRSEAPLSFKMVGVHIPCNTTLFHKKEYQLIEDPIRASIVCEHYLVLTILAQIVDTLANVLEVNQAFTDHNESLRTDFEYMMSIRLTPDDSYLEAIRKFVQKEVINTQRLINHPSSDAFYQNALSFASLIIPVLDSIKRVALLKDAHFLLMIDDAHDLNEYQVKTLNSWIAYRDHNNYSFKVAIAKVGEPYSYKTATNGFILEGHDYTSVEMEKPFLNKDSSFAKMAKNIVQRRLDIAGLSVLVDDFFPANPNFLADLKAAEIHTKEQATKKYEGGTAKQIGDYVYKYGRAEYFRQRAAKANRPPYSGFDTIINISTGVVRNLLDPCFWMYDNVISQKGEQVTQIPWATQNDIIVERSEAKWESIRQLHSHIDGCTEQQSTQLYCLLDNLMLLFRERLLNHKSEPRAIIFTVSGKNTTTLENLMVLLTIAQKAQLLYTRTGNSKDDGRRDIYYIPNRILLPARGLDPLGQHAHAQLKSIDLWAAAERNKPFPLVAGTITNQPTLFDE